jgi:hypothetical protein
MMRRRVRVEAPQQSPMTTGVVGWVRVRVGLSVMMISVCQSGGVHLSCRVRS